MMRKLYLLRHAQAVSGSPSLSDEMRALTPDGERVSTQVGEYLKLKNSNLNLIITSSAIRTRQTGLRVAQQLEPQPEIQVERTIYIGDEFAILKLLTALPDTLKEVLLVGHYPTIVDLHNYLAPANRIPAMNTGELIALHFDTSWQMLSAGMATFEYTFHPHFS